jgi:hypothetical protein
VILIAVASLYCSLLHEAIDQLHGGVMAMTKPVREGRHRGASSFRQTLDSEEKLVLLRLDVTGASGLFTEVEELADAVTEFRKLAISLSRKLSPPRSRANTTIAGNHFTILN